MSELSKALKQKFGIPEINLNKNAATAPVIKAFSADILRQLLKEAADEDLDLAEMMIEMERKRRAKQ